MVEIGIMDRQTKKILTTKVEKDNQVFFSYGQGFEENKLAVYAFESNVVLFQLSENKSIENAFKKKYKILRSNTVKRYRKEGLI